MYTNHAEYFQYLLKLLNTYGINQDTLSNLSLVGFTTHALADIHDTVNYVSRQAINESYIMTATKLDSLYKHAREVDIFPTLSIPASMDFILIINEEDFKQVATVSGRTRSYVIDKSNYIKVGDFIYSLDHDLEISIQNTSNDSESNIPYMTARYLEDLYDELPDVLKTIPNKTIKVVRRKTQRGWEYHLYLTLKQYSREVYEKEFIDRDYSAYNYTANGELVGIKVYRIIDNPKQGQSMRSKLDLKMYFETSRTSQDSIYIQFESSNSFNLIHKSQDNGFRPELSDKMHTYIYTTAGARGNFTYAKQIGPDIKLIPNNDMDLDITVYLEDGISKGGVSFTNDKEQLRRDIITKKSTRDSLLTENDILMRIKKAARNKNDHYVIKYRNDIRRIFNVFTTLKHTQDGIDYVIPTNTIDITWNLEDTIVNKETTGVGTATLDTIGEGVNAEKWYNNSTFLVESRKHESGFVENSLVPSTFEKLLNPLMEEFRLGITQPIYNAEGNAIIIGDKEIEAITPTTTAVYKDKPYFYNNRIYYARRNKIDCKPGELELLTSSNIHDGVNTDSDNALFETDEKIYYWFPYYMSYVRSNIKNYVKIYDQTIDKKNNLSYNLHRPTAPFTFICNWMVQLKDSVFNPYMFNIHVRNNLTNYSLVDNGFLVKAKDGGYLNTNKLQVYLILEDKTGHIVYSEKFKIKEYNAIENSNDDYLDMYVTLLPAGFVPRIIDDKISVMNEYTDSWVDIPITDLKATVKIYHIDTDNQYKNRAGESVVNEEVFILDNNGPDTRDVTYTNGDGESFTEKEKGRYVKLFKDVKFSSNNSYQSEEFLINTYSADLDIFEDFTDLFKPQHSILNSTQIKLHALPVIQYTFYKFYANIFKKAIEGEKDILKYVHSYQGEFSTSLKFTNTYGFSKYYTIGKNRRPLNNVQLDLSFLVKYYTEDTTVSPQEISNAIATYVRGIDFLNFDVFHISKLYDYVMDSYSGVISYLEFVSANGNLHDNQLIEMNVDNIKNDTIIEKINIPYTFNGGFKHSVNWKVIKENKKK